MFLARDIGEIMKKWLTVIILTMMLVPCIQTALYMPVTANATSVSVNEPALIVVKNLQKANYSLGEEILIEIVIQNVGDAVLYDINVTDVVFEEWSFETRGISSVAYMILYPGQTISFKYSIIPKHTGTFVSKPATATYYTSTASNDQRVIYESSSNDVYFTVSEYEAVDNRMIMLTDIFSVIVLLYIVLITINTISHSRKTNLKETDTADR